MHQVDRGFIGKIAAELEQANPEDWAARSGVSWQALVETIPLYLVLGADSGSAAAVALFQLGYEVRRAQEES